MWHPILQLGDRLTHRLRRRAECSREPSEFCLTLPFVALVRLEGTYLGAPRRHQRFQMTPGNRHRRNDAVILGHGYPLTDVTGCRLFVKSCGFRVDRAIGPFIRGMDRV